MKRFDLYRIDVKDHHKNDVWNDETHVSLYAHNKLQDLAEDDRIHLDRVSLVARFVRVPDLIQVIPAILHCEDKDINCWIVAHYKIVSGLASGVDGFRCLACLQEDFDASVNYITKDPYSA